MGIRFACHHCSHPLNVKNDLAGRVGVCPKCRGRFRIPSADSTFSQSLRQPENGNAVGTSPQSSQGSGETFPRRQAVVAGDERVLDESAQAVSEVPPGGAVTGSPLDESAAQWYVRPPAGGQYGPATGEVMRLWIVENRITPSTLVWRDGWPQWRSAREVLPELGNGPASSVASGSPFLGQSAETHVGVSAESRGGAAAIPSASGYHGLVAGNPKVGQTRWARNRRRTALIVGLALLSILLVAALIFLAMRDGS
jgi:hypothetical protein